MTFFQYEHMISVIRKFVVVWVCLFLEKYVSQTNFMVTRKQ